VNFSHSLRAFRHRNYRLFCSGQSLSIIGTWIQLLAMSWLVYRMTGSAFLLGVTTFAGQIAITLLAPFGGIWADRFDRRKLLIATQTLALIQGFALAALTYSGLVEVWHIVVMASLLGIVNAFDIPIRQSFTPEMVPSKQDLPSALAFNGIMQNGGRMIGPAIAGLLLTVFSEAFCFLLNGLSKIAVLVSILLLTLPRHDKPRATHNVWHGLREGVVYAWNTLPVRTLLPILALTSFMITPYQSLMPIYAAEVFAGGADTLGFLIGAAGLGGVMGLLFLASRRDVRGLTRWTLTGPALAGICLTIFAYSSVLWFSLLLMWLVGFGMMLTVGSVNMILQSIIDDTKRGRVMSFFAMSFMGMTPVGSLAAGWLAEHIGAQATFVACGLSAILATLLLLRQLPVLRIHMRRIYQELGMDQGKTTARPD